MDSGSPTLPCFPPSFRSAIGSFPSVHAAVRPKPTKGVYLGDFNVIRLLGGGDGDGGATWLVRRRADGKMFVLKTVRLPAQEDENAREHRWRLIVSLNQSPNIVPVHAFDEGAGGEIRLLLKYMKRGSLEGQHLSMEAYVGNLAFQLVSSLSHLHSWEIAHGDLRPHTILLNEGNATQAPVVSLSPNVYQHMSRHSLPYWSPERLNPHLSQGLSDDDVLAGDIWSLGMSILEVFIGSYPYGKDLAKAADLEPLKTKICHGDPPRAPPTSSPLFQDFIASCLWTDPKKRAKAGELLRHPFLTSSV